MNHSNNHSNSRNDYSDKYNNPNTNDTNNNDNISIATTTSTPINNGKTNLKSKSSCARAQHYSLLNETKIQKIQIIVAGYNSKSHHLFRTSHTYPLIPTHHYFPPTHISTFHTIILDFSKIISTISKKRRTPRSYKKKSTQRSLNKTISTNSHHNRNPLVCTLRIVHPQPAVVSLQSAVVSSTVGSRLL